MASKAIARGLFPRMMAANRVISSSSVQTGRSSFFSILDDHHRRWFSSYPSHELVGMPSLSPTMEAGSIASWNLDEGESFSAGDVLCEVETDKATVSFEAQDDGVLAKIIAGAGPAEINCGEPICITVEEEEDVDAFKNYVVEESALSPPPATEAAPAPAAVEPVAPPTPTEIPTPAATPSVTSTGGRVIASPLAWTEAKSRGLDLSSVAIVGTGPDGRIIADDVKEYVPMAASIPDTATATTSSTPTTTTGISSPMAATLPPVQGIGYTDYPLSPAAMELAAQLTASKQSVPHYYLTVDVTLDDILSLRSTLNASMSLGEDESGISLNDLMVKAAAVSMKACPTANAAWMGDSVRVYETVDANVVVGNGDALYAPVVRNVAGRGVKSISEDIASAVAKVGEDVVEGEEFGQVGTFTMMNLGMYGIKSCAPIIREPQAVALALGAPENRIVPNDDPDSDEIYKESVMLTATLSCDHRVVDGAVGAQWLSAFKKAVENPSTLLL
eukprot:CAMPEP_0184859814 /NCGR_PEP_ID=MMETSP0580-20130426/4799_1 /TAXON_ID=1118495 /ORGANISM="Dactyliosolen fragilissimus" /LENGTH=502 /DNA_ID=CAMNT_0027356657 /DNA_START=216 /DNA_END=1724 /DNA_ORIENTATION=-